MFNTTTSVPFTEDTPYPYKDHLADAVWETKHCLLWDSWNISMHCVVNIQWL